MILCFPRMTKDPGMFFASTSFPGHPPSDVPGTEAYTRCSYEDSARCKSEYLAVWQSLSPIDAYMSFPFVNTHFFYICSRKNLQLFRLKIS